MYVPNAKVLNVGDVLPSKMTGDFEIVRAASRAYNAAKVTHIRAMAKKYRHLITEETYRALFKWQVPSV